MFVCYERDNVIFVIKWVGKLVNFKLVRQIKEKNVSTFSFYLLAWRFPRLLYLSLVYINSLTHHSSSACGRNFVEQIWSNEFALRCRLTLVAKRTSLFKSDLLPIFLSTTQMARFKLAGLYEDMWTRKPITISCLSRKSYWHWLSNRVRRSL